MKKRMKKVFKSFKRNFRSAMEIVGESILLSNGMISR